MRIPISILAFLLIGAAAAQAESVNVAAAANIVPALEELAKTFERANPGTDIKIIGGSSGRLSTQIRNGAPFDLFLSADMEFPMGLAKDGFAVGGAVVYARGSLILFARKGLDFSAGLAAVERADTVAIAKPELAPYGRAALEALEAAKLLERTEPKFVYAENISQAAQFCLTAADSGFINKSVLFTPAFAAFRDKEGRNWIEVPEGSYRSIDQGAILLKRGSGTKGAGDFFAYLFSDGAKVLFRSYGYAVN